MADTTTQSATGTNPFATGKQSDIPSDGFKIRGISDYDNVLMMLKLAARSKSSPELRVNKATVVLLQGKENWELWRKRLANFLQPTLGGRLWHLMLAHPATSVEAYQQILAESDDAPVSYEEASAVRYSDLVLIGSNVCQTLSDEIVDDVCPASDEGYDPVNGQELWSKLVDRFASSNVSLLQAAEKDLSSFTLGDLTAKEVGRDLKQIFARIYNAGGGQVPEHRKIGKILACFTNSRFENTRAAIEENWSNDYAYTFDAVVNRFVNAETLVSVFHGESGNQDGVRALRVQPVVSASTSIKPKAKGKSHRNNKSGGACWWCTIPGHGISVCEKKRRGDHPHPNSEAAAKGWHQEPPQKKQQPQYVGFVSPQQPAPYPVGARLMIPYQGGMGHATAMHAYVGAGALHMQQPYLVYPAYADTAHPTPHFGGQHTPPSLAHRIGEVPANSAPTLSLAQRLSDPSNSEYFPGHPY
ncbi:hypothetical protein A4X03_0g6906 [Tilletia caries]|uniref:Uncharacterized protein n=3 Tax=Tilletia TaxID=13289 RepID=A0A8T8SST7_9BASI|nr:hypothetical protein A4X03_0g6906 [Tilletia caries]